MTSTWLLAGWTMLHFLWIGTLIGALNALGRLFLHRAAPSLRYAWSLFGFALLALAPATIACALFETARSPIYSHGITQAASLPEPVGTDIPHVLPIALDQPPPTALAAAPSLTPFVRILPALWLVGSPLTFTVLAFGLAGTERLRRSATILAPDHPLAATAARLAHDIGRIRPFAVATSTRIASPLLLGILRPLILLPATAAGWPPDHLEMVLLHELAHLRRHDNLVNLLQRLVESALFFHPAVWLSSRWLRIDRELCCDTLVVSRTAQPRAYAELLLSLREASSLHVPAVAMSEGPLTARVRHILQVEDPLMRLSRPSLALAATLLAAPAVVFLQPAPAQEPPTPASAVLAELHKTLEASPGDSQSQCRAFVCIARAQSKQGDRTAALLTLAHAADVAAASRQRVVIKPNVISAGAAPAVLLAEIAHEQATLGDREVALATLNRAVKLAENSAAPLTSLRLDPVARLACEFRDLGALDDARAMAALADRQAERIATNFMPITHGLFYIQELAKAHTAAGDLDGAFAIVDRIASAAASADGPNALSRGFYGIVRGLEGADGPRVERAVEGMLARINNLQLGPRDERSLAAVIELLTHKGDFDRATQLLAQTQGLAKVRALTIIAIEQHKRGDLSHARRTAQSAADLALTTSPSLQRDGELATLVQRLIRLGDLESALRCADAIPHELHIHSLASIARAQRQTGDPAAAHATTLRALTQLEALEAALDGPSPPRDEMPLIMGQDSPQSRYFHLRIEALACGGDFDRARALVECLPPNSPERQSATLTVAREMARSGQPADALTWTRSLNLNPSLQPQIASAILDGLADLQ